MFGRKFIWNDPKVKTKMWEWYEHYVDGAPQHKELSALAKMVLSKPAGIGADERLWGEMTRVWTSQRSSLGVKKALKAVEAYSAFQGLKR